MTNVYGRIDRERPDPLATWGSARRSRRRSPDRPPAAALPVKAVSDGVSLPELTRVRLGLRFLLQRLRLLRLGPRDRPAMLDAVVKRLASLDSGR